MPVIQKIIEKIVFVFSCLMILGGGGQLLYILISGVRKNTSDELVVLLDLIFILIGGMGLHKFFRKDQSHQAETKANLESKGGRIC